MLKDAQKITCNLCWCTILGVALSNPISVQSGASVCPCYIDVYNNGVIGTSSSVGEKAFRIYNDYNGNRFLIENGRGLHVISTTPFT